MTTPSIAAVKKREIGEEAGEVLVLGHVADAEDKNAKRDERDHDQHRGRQRIEHPADAQRLFAESEPGEIVKRAKSGRRAALAGSRDGEHRAR